MDIVEQLRKSANTIYKQDGYTFRLGLQNEAADEIERLRDALRKIKKRNPFHNVSPPMDKQYYAQIITEMVTIANAALKESE